MTIFGNFWKISFAGCNKETSWHSKILITGWTLIANLTLWIHNQNVAIYTIKLEIVKFKFKCNLATIMMYSHVFKLRIHEFEDFLCFWPLMAFIGLHWPFWPLLALNDFSRLRVVFLSKNNR